DGRGELGKCARSHLLGCRSEGNQSLADCRVSLYVPGFGHEQCAVSGRPKPNLARPRSTGRRPSPEPSLILVLEQTTMNEIDPALAKLANIMGPQRAKIIIAETMREIGLLELRTPDDRARFGSALVARGGVLEAVGRAIKIQAILHGAKEP